jgi:hypothetical protein
VKPKHLVAVRGFLSFVALCQLVISLNVKLAHAHVFFNVSALILFSPEIWGCGQPTAIDGDHV